MGLLQVDSIYTLTVKFDENGQVIACQKVPRTRAYYEDTGETFATQIYDPVDIGFDEVVALLHLTPQSVETKTAPDNFIMDSGDQ